MAIHRCPAGCQELSDKLEDVRKNNELRDGQPRPLPLDTELRRVVMDNSDSTVGRVELGRLAEGMLVRVVSGVVDAAGIAKARHTPERRVEQLRLLPPPAAASGRKRRRGKQPPAATADGPIGVAAADGGRLEWVGVEAVVTVLAPVTKRLLLLNAAQLKRKQDKVEDELQKAMEAAGTNVDPETIAEDDAYDEDGEDDADDEVRPCQPCPSFKSVAAPACIALTRRPPPVSVCSGRHLTGRGMSSRPRSRRLGS